MYTPFNWLKLPAQFPKPICAADVGTTLDRFLTPTGDAEAGEPTIVKIWRDQTALFLEAECRTAAMARVRRSSKYDRDQQSDDTLELQIDVGQTQRQYVHIIVLPNGTVTTYRGSSNRVEQGFHPALSVKVTLRKNAWIVRVAIPFAELGRVPHVGEVWGFNVLRVNRSEPTGYVQWSPTIEDGTRPDLFGTIRFAVHPKAPARAGEVAAYRHWARERQEYFLKAIHRLEDFVTIDLRRTTFPVRWEGIALGKRGIPECDHELVMAKAKQLRTQIAVWMRAIPASAKLAKPSAKAALKPAGSTLAVGAVLSTMSWAALADAYLLTGDASYAIAFEEALQVREVVIGQLLAASDKPHGPLYSDFEICCVAALAYAFLTLDKMRRFGAAARESMLRSVLRSARYAALRISAGYFYGNHQMFECAGLAILATLFPDFPESRSWARIASRGLAEHLRREVMADGGYGERCGYQSVAMNFTTQAVVTIQFNHAEKLFPELMSRASLRRLEKMYEWIRALRAPDHTLPGFGDYPLYPQLRVLQQGAHALRNPALLRPPANQSVTLAASQFTVMRSRQFYMAVDHGGLGGQHSHCDSMGFVAYAFGEPVAVEGNLTDYPDPLYTQWFRKIQAHNVVIVDGAEPEKVAEQLAWRSTPRQDVLKMLGRGYEHSHGVIHERTIVFNKDGFWFIFDRLKARTAGHQFAWTLHTPVRLRARADKSMAGLSPSGQVGLLVLPGDLERLAKPTLDFKPCATLKPGCSWVRAADMTRSSANLPMVTYQQPQAQVGDTTFATVLLPYRGKCPQAKLVILTEGVYELTVGPKQRWQIDVTK